MDTFHIAVPVQNESDVEQKIALPLLTTPQPHGLGYKIADIQTKANVRGFAIEKGKAEKIYFPDYIIAMNGYPHLVIEAKGPGVDLTEAYREARLYAGELNAVFPNKVNPVHFVAAINDQELWLGNVDVAVPEIIVKLSSISPYTLEFSKAQEMISRTAVYDLNRKFLLNMRPLILKKPRDLVGGESVQSEEIGHNSFGAAIHSQFSDIFNPSTYAERKFIAQHAYVSSKRRERYIDPIDRVIRASRPASELHAVEIEDSHKPHEVVNAIRTFSSSTDVKDLENRILLVVGSVGSGKTTFIDHLKEVALPVDLRDQTLWVRINMNPAPNNATEIYDWIRNEIIKECQKSLPEIDFDSLDGVQKLYAPEINKFNKTYGNLYGKDSDIYKIKLGERISDLQANLHDTARAYTRFCGTERNKLVITVLDNCDKRTRDVQLLTFEVAQWMQREFRTLILLPLRDETFDNYRDIPPLDTSLNDFVFRIEPPMFHQVLVRRVQLALDRISAGGGTLEYDLPNGMRVSYGPSDLSYYLTSILNSVFEHDRYVRRMLIGLTGRNIRRALEIFIEFCTSGHIREDEIFKIRQKHGVYSLPLNVVSRVLLRRNRRYYDSNNSYVKNLLAADRNDDKPYYFTRLAILRWLRDRFNDRGPSNHAGYFPVSDIQEGLARIGIDIAVTKREIEYLVAAHCITTEDFSTSFVSEAMLVRLAPAGFVNLEMLQNPVYLAAISEDTLFDSDSEARAVLGRIRDVKEHYTDTTTLSNAETVLDFFDKIIKREQALPTSYLNKASFDDLITLSTAREYVEALAREVHPSGWLLARQNYPINAIVDCVVTSVKDQGAFVEMEPGVWGLIHTSKYPPDTNHRYFIQTNERLRAKIIGADQVRHRFSLEYISHIGDV